MTTIIVATKNAHKVREMNELLADLGSIKLITMAEAGLDADIEENGKTFTAVHPLEKEARVREIARIIGGDDITPLKLKMAEEMLLG